MPTSPRENLMPALTAPWSDLGAVIRCWWSSAHRAIEIRAVTISGAQVLDKRAAIQSGGEVPIRDVFVPFGCAVRWSVVVFVDDVTEAPLEGVFIAVELKDAEGRGVRHLLCSEEKIPANRAAQIAGVVDAPERDHA